MGIEDTLAQLRDQGWMVVCHNDYRLNGALMTFWSFARGDEYVKGEGTTDDAALLECARAAKKTAPMPLVDKPYKGYLARVLEDLGTPHGSKRSAGELVVIDGQWPEFIIENPTVPVLFDVWWGVQRGYGDPFSGRINRVQVKCFEVLGPKP